MGSHRKSIVKEAVDRLEEKMAIKQSRGKVKAALRAAGEMGWTGSTERIHSFKTRSVYQGHVVRFIRWVRTTYQIKDLAQVDARADELATRYLQRHLAEGKSAYTLQAERSALRLFFANRSLAQQVELPRRTRVTIRRSREVVAHDRHFQAANWQPLLRFLQATGLRRNEVRLLVACDIVVCETEGDYQGQTVVKVRNGKGGKSRTVPVLVGHERDVLCLGEGRQDDEPVFSRIPKHLDVHSYRRVYAQALYLSLAPGRLLPPQTGRLNPRTYDAEAVMAVSKALGHRRKDVVLHHYLR